MLNMYSTVNKEELNGKHMPLEFINVKTFKKMLTFTTLQLVGVNIFIKHIMN